MAIPRCVVSGTAPGETPEDPWRAVRKSRCGKGMSRKAVRPRNPWEDRFQAPEASDLVGAMPRHLASLVEHTRESLQGLGGVVETIVWRGVPWRWTFCYADEADPGRPWGYLVPQAGRPVLSIPISSDVVQLLPMKRLSKPVKDGIALAAQVAGVFWPQWDLSSKSQIAELVEIARKRREGLLTATA